MLKQNLVLIGNGIAGVRTLEEVLKLDADRFNITVLAKEKTIDEIMLNDEQWYTDNGITLHKGKKIETIDRAKQRVIAADGTDVAYDRLIIATGSIRAQKCWAMSGLPA